MKFRSLVLKLILFGCLALSPLAQAVEPPYNPVPRDENYLKEDLARLAKDPKNPVLLREAGMSYNIVGPENIEYVKKAKALLEESNRLRPNDPYTLMFLGSTYALLARSSEVSILNKSSVLSDGLALMDRSIQIEPNSYRLRLMRATSSLAVPSFIASRSKELEIDVAYVRKVIEPTPPKEIPKHSIAAGYLLLGAYHEKKDEDARARQYFQLAQSFGRGTVYEERAKKRLEGLN